MHFGKRNIVYDEADVALKYHELAEKDFASANILAINELYNEAAYFYIQAMEKYTKEQICHKIDPSNKYFANIIKDTGHSLDKSLTLLIEIYCGKDLAAKQQIENILLKNILKDTKFEILNNTLRYPRYEYKYENYTVIELSKEDTDILCEMTSLLKKALNDLYKIR